MSGPVEAKLRAQLEADLKPEQLEIKNESPQHGLPESAEKHFRVFVVSATFESLSRIERHRLVHTAAADLLKTAIHALAVQAKTPAEALLSKAKIESPACLGGGKRDR